MNEQTVNNPMLTVEHWRERFHEAARRFPSLATIADEIGPLDPDFTNGTGFVRLKNIQADRGGLEYTAKAVELMNRVRPPETAQPQRKDRLSRQGLTRNAGPRKRN